MLRIDDDANLGISPKFCMYLEDKMYSYIKNKLSAKNTPFQQKLFRMEQYINSDIPKIKKYNYSKRHLSLHEIITVACLNLRYSKSGQSYFIEIDPTQIIYGTFLKMNDICKLIDQGTVDIQGLHIFTEMFEYFESNMDSYIQEYYIRNWR